MNITQLNNVLDNELKSLPLYISEGDGLYSCASEIRRVELRYLDGNDCLYTEEELKERLIEIQEDIEDGLIYSKSDTTFVKVLVLE